MTREEIEKYLAGLSDRVKLDRYVSRRFTAVDTSGSLPDDFDYRLRSTFRDREPEIAELLTHPRVVVLAEPGGGKSVVSNAATRELISRGGTVPVFVELREYRSTLPDLLARYAPPALLDPGALIDGNPMLRTYVLDGVDEIHTELLDRFSAELSALRSFDKNGRLFITARQAFYFANQALFSDLPSVFHILGFNDDDVDEYARKSGVDEGLFREALITAGATELARNPFLLSTIVERFRDSGALSDWRTENICYMVNRLVQQRPRFDQHRQRRALRFLALAMETYARNELTDDEALRVVKECMHITDQDAPTLLDELNASILKRTSNGLAFQTRSFGEYLAAEVLEDEKLDRIQELVFINHETPNDSWRNAVSYLAELNPTVRELFVRRYPEWMVDVSPAALSPVEKDTVLSQVVDNLNREERYVTEGLRLGWRDLAALVTERTEAKLFDDLRSPSESVQGNALLLLGLRKRPEVLPAAMVFVGDIQQGLRLRHCALLAIINAGGPREVGQLLPLLDSGDPLRDSLIDAVGALAADIQLHEILPRVLSANGFLVSTYYHFRELTTREALLVVLRYAAAHPDEMNSFHARTYLEPFLRLFDRYWDDEIGGVCADVLGALGTRLVHPDPQGLIPMLFKRIQKVDAEGLTARIYIERLLRGNGEGTRTVFWVDQILSDLMTPAAARWLVDQEARPIVERVAGYVSGEVREILRPYSGGLIDAQDANAKRYREEEKQRQAVQRQEIELVQERLLARSTLQAALPDFAGLTKSHWPELPAEYLAWLARAISEELVRLDLEHTVQWKGSTLWQPRSLSLLLEIVDRYELKLEPDEPLVFAITGLPTEATTRFFQRFGFSQAAVNRCESILFAPPSLGALQGMLGFLGQTGLYTESVQGALKEIVLRPLEKQHIQAEALSILIKQGVDEDYLVTVRASEAGSDAKGLAFETLVGLQHRPTIERALAVLLQSDEELRSGEAGFPMTSSLAWIGKIRAPLAWNRLAEVRERALQLQIPHVVGIVTEAMANIDRRRTAKLIRKQTALAPESWRPAQQAHAAEQELRSRLEEAHRIPFDEVLRKLKGSTSMNRFKLLCEGSTDVPVFRALLAQVADVPEVILDHVGGWGDLRTRNPNNMLLGCKEAAIVMDGDQGRHLNKRKKPLTPLAKDEKKKFSDFPITFFVLGRYGIENYFPQRALEKVVAIDLSQYYPIPDDVPVDKYLSEDYRSLPFRVRWFFASILKLRRPSPSRPLYSKHLNQEVARLISLDSDLRGTDLSEIILQIARRARDLSET